MEKYVVSYNTKKGTSSLVSIRFRLEPVYDLLTVFLLLLCATEACWLNLVCSLVSKWQVDSVSQICLIGSIMFGGNMSLIPESVSIAVNMTQLWVSAVAEEPRGTRFFPLILPTRWHTDHDSAHDKMLKAGGDIYLSGRFIRCTISLMWISNQQIIWQQTMYIQTWSRGSTAVRMN